MASIAPFGNGGQLELLDFTSLLIGWIDRTPIGAGGQASNLTVPWRVL